MTSAIFLTFLLSAVAQYVTGQTCVCSGHNSRPVYPCINTGRMFVGVLRNDAYDQHCMPEADGVVTPSGWMAGIFEGYLVYVEVDVLVTAGPCAMPTPKGLKITYEKSCPPLMKPGHVLNPTTSTTSTSTTTASTIATTTTTKTTTTSTTTTPTITTPSPTPALVTARVTTPKPTHSQKCDFWKIASHLVHQTSASHPNARQCPDGTRTQNEALILDTCKNSNINMFAWKQELKVIDHCYSIPQGEPLAYFINGRPVGISAVFWNCTSLTSFQIASQSCGSHLRLVDVDATTTLRTNFFFSISW